MVHAHAYTHTHTYTHMPTHAHTYTHIRADAILFSFVCKQLAHATDCTSLGNHCPLGLVRALSVEVAFRKHVQPTSVRLMHSLP